MYPLCENSYFFTCRKSYLQNFAENTALYTPLNIIMYSIIRSAKKSYFLYLSVHLNHSQCNYQRMVTCSMVFQTYIGNIRMNRSP